MAFSVSFPTTGPCPSRDSVASWLTELREPFDPEGDGTLVLRAMPVRFVALPDQGALHAHLEVNATVPLTRLVGVLFDVSVRAGADVRLTGVGEIARSGLWMRLADEQDRIRIHTALTRAEEHGRLESVLTRLWAVVSALRPLSDDRWDRRAGRIVALKEVGSADGISRDDALWHAEDPETGDVVLIPVDHAHHVHTLAWRWLSEAYPGLAVDTHHHTLH